MKTEDRERYAQEVCRSLDRLDQLAEEAVALQQDIKARAAEEKVRLRHWRNLLAGKKGEQLPLPEGKS